MAKAKKKAPGRKKGAVVPRALPAVVTRKPTQQARAAVTKVRKKAQEIADREVRLSHVGAGVAGAGVSMFTSSWLADREWMSWISPEWQSVVLTGLGATGSYVAYHHDKPHLSWGLGGWAAGTAYFGGISALSRQQHRKEMQQLVAASTQNASGQTDKPRNAPDPHYEDERNDELLQLAEDRVRELEDELAEARARLTPEIELAHSRPMASPP